MKNFDITAELIENQLKGGCVNKYAYTLTESRMKELTAKNSIFSLLRTTFSSSLSLSVFINGGKGTKVSSSLSPESIENTVDDAVKAAESSAPDPAYDIAPPIGEETMERGDEENMDLFLERINELLAYIKKNYPNINVIDTVGQHRHYRTIYRNSNGTKHLESGSFYTVYLGFSAVEGEKRGGMKYSSIVTKTLEKPFIELSSFKRDLEGTSKSLETVSCSGKFTGSVIFTPSCLSTFLYYLRDYISDTAIQEGTSPWRNKLGEKVADSSVTLRLESSNPAIVDGETITDDGFRTEDVTLIENGVLKSFCLSIYCAAKTGLEPTKNSSFDIVMDEGTETFESLVKNIKRGLIVGGFSGGRPSINGDFSGVAKNSFFIEDGVVKGAVNETMISGNILAMLNNVIGITKERISDGESVLPYLAVEGIVISGK